MKKMFIYFLLHIKSNNKKIIINNNKTKNSIKNNK